MSEKKEVIQKIISYIIDVAKLVLLWLGAGL